MITIRTKAEMRAWTAAERAEGRTVALVPTMGAFHAGHHALMRAARAAADRVVVSLFVNPAQFEEAADLAAYPRTEASDTAGAEQLGVDVLFAPTAGEMYPDGFATSVRVDGLGEILEGAERGPGHFAGVCTVVTKLFTVVGPDVAYFGQKDAQQVAVLRRMTTDLDLPVRLEVIPIVREPDGLAMSSRNGRLAPAERERAIALSQGLRAASDAIAAGERDAARLHAAAAAAMERHGVEPEYLALVDPDSFRPVQAVNGRVLVAVAARLGETRLIDNALIETTT
ncbi:MAG: pantoate--beta-alanine ligase [Solirubrobacteraceae bacterium]|nr:pantoate--beta-alanine ligase [Solirubrobacteraceae bacterium]